MGRSKGYAVISKRPMKYQFWCSFKPLNACQDSCNVVGRRPSILQNIQTEFTGSVHIWMEHLAEELDRRRLVRVLLFEVHDKSEGSIFKGSVGWANDNGIPAPKRSANSDPRDSWLEVFLPGHNIVCNGRCGNTGWRICLHALNSLSVFDLMIACSDEETFATDLEVAHEATSSSSRHVCRVYASVKTEYCLS